MKTVVVNNQKGGVGKTTLAAHIGWYLAEIQGARVLLVDMDPQQNLTSVFPDVHKGPTSGDMFFEAIEPTQGPEGLTIFAADGRLHDVPANANTVVGRFIKNMQALRGCYDYCVIDTAPTWGASTFAAVASASGMLSPMDLGKFSLDGARTLLQQLQTINEQVRSAKPVELFGLLVSRYNSGSPEQRKTLAQVAETYSNSVLFPGVITQRQSYEQAVSRDENNPLCRPVWAMKGNTAAQAAGKEIRDILDHLKERLDQAGDAL